MTLREFVERISEAITATYAEHGEVRPMYHIVMSDNQVLTMPAPPVPKYIAVEIMKELFKKAGVTRYCFTDEAWIVSTKADDKVKTIEDAKKWRETQPQPSDHPDRKEVVLFFAEDENEGFHNARRWIERDADGKGTLGPLSSVDESASVVFGQMTGLLPVKGTPQ